MVERCPKKDKEGGWRHNTGYGTDGCFLEGGKTVSSVQGCLVAHMRLQFWHLHTQTDEMVRNWLDCFEIKLNGFCLNILLTN